jgi:hypothetical protein
MINLNINTIRAVFRIQESVFRKRAIKAEDGIYKLKSRIRKKKIRKYMVEK